MKRFVTAEIHLSPAKKYPLDMAKYFHNPSHHKILIVLVAEAILQTAEVCLFLMFRLADAVLLHLRVVNQALENKMLKIVSEINECKTIKRKKGQHNPSLDYLTNSVCTTQSMS